MLPYTQIYDFVPHEYLCRNDTTSFHDSFFAVSQYRIIIKTDLIVELYPYQPGRCPFMKINSTALAAVIDAQIAFLYDSEAFFVI